MGTATSELERRRRAKRLTQERLAVAAGVTSRTVRDVEKGTTRPSFRTQEKLAAALDCDPAELWPAEARMTPPSQPLARTANPAAAHAPPRAAAPSFRSEAERARLGIRPEGRPNPGPERQTHGRHCLCTPCCRQDWSEPQLAPCGMHGSVCPPVYDPYERAAAPSSDEAPPSLCVRCGIRAAALQGFCEGCWDLRCVWADETVDDA